MPSCFSLGNRLQLPPAHRITQPAVHILPRSRGSVSGCCTPASHGLCMMSGALLPGLCVQVTHKLLLVSSVQCQGCVFSHPWKSRAGVPPTHTNGVSGTGIKHHPFPPTMRILTPRLVEASKLELGSLCFPSVHPTWTPLNTLSRDVHSSANKKKSVLQTPDPTLM